MAGTAVQCPGGLFVLDLLRGFSCHEARGGVGDVWGVVFAYPQRDASLGGKRGAVQDSGRLGKILLRQLPAVPSRAAIYDRGRGVQFIASVKIPVWF